MSALPALVVDVQGLAKLVERRGKDFAVLELVQNAWDEDVTTVDVELEYLGHNKARLTVTDDSPEGFRDLSHAFTMFADSYKKDDPNKRGRFNLGEKLVIALSDTVEIRSTKGGVLIDVKNNTRKMIRAKRKQGTEFVAVLRMTQAEVNEAEARFHTLIAPEGIATKLNGKTLLPRQPIHTFEATLATEAADAEGFLRPTRRKATIEVYSPKGGEAPAIYEMGLPVVATHDRYHLNIMQKVPLNTDRDNVTPAYLKDLRALVVNEMATRMSAEESSATWVNVALEDDLIEPEAVEEIMTKRFGEKRVAFDPSDLEANKIAASEGYTVVPGRALSRDAWKNVKQYETVQPAGQVTPSPKPYSETGDSRKEIPEEKWTEGMRNVAEFSQMVAEYVLGASVQVVFTSDVTWPYLATYGRGCELTYNKGKLGKAFFENGIDEHVIDLLIHEYGHHYESDHLSRNYYKALTKIGARLMRLALDRPELFEPFELNIEAVAIV